MWPPSREELLKQEEARYDQDARDEFTTKFRKEYQREPDETDILAYVESERHRRAYVVSEPLDTRQSVPEIIAKDSTLQAALERRIE